MKVLVKAVEQGPWLMGEQFTAADVVIGANIRWGMIFKLIPCARSSPTTPRALRREPKEDKKVHVGKTVHVNRSVHRNFVVGRMLNGHVWYGHRRHYWHGRWYDYGVGPCWINVGGEWFWNLLACPI